jgi:chorismate lyase/3-hydroxybenzoate synthase
MPDAVAVPPHPLRHDPKYGALPLPSWVSGLVGSAGRDWKPIDSGLSVQIVSTPDFTLTSVRVADAVSMRAKELTSRTTQAYQVVLEPLDPTRGLRLVRVWNFIPRILDALDDAPQRYFAFNAGRFAAYERVYADSEASSRKVATASGVGHFGSDLVIHGLASRFPSSPVENPRQVPAYRYSRKYGPLPPCFARATRVDTGNAQWLLVGGTASIVGEGSRHINDLEAQTAETLLNLATLVAAGAGSSSPNPQNSAEWKAPLQQFRHVRIYHRRSEHEAFVHKFVKHEFSGAQTVEILTADLCRPPLLIEIEGIAEI